MMDNKRKIAPHWLSHKPVISVDYEKQDGNAGDAKFLSIGRSTWNKEDFSAKVWRQNDSGYYSRQSEELPLWRVLDLATLIAAAINGRKSSLDEIVQDEEFEPAMRDYLAENMEILAPRLEALTEMLKPTNEKSNDCGEPNIFSFATSELSQDAMFAWLIEWADPKNAAFDVSLNRIAQDFLRMLMGKSESFPIESVEVGRQWENIDVWVEVNENSFLVIEDKTGTSIHDDQLKRYRESAENYYKGTRSDLCYAYVKTGNEPESILKTIRNNGYITVNRNDIIKCLNKYDGQNVILINYRNHLQKIEDATLSYHHLPVDKWGWNAWQGFYKELESRLSIDSWSYVSNPAGGFLGIWWHNTDIEGGSMYLQIEQGKLCFKIYYEGDKDRSNIRWHHYRQIIDLASKLGYNEIHKPDRFGAGTYMTIAIVSREDLFGTQEVDIDKVVEKLKTYQAIIDKVCNSV